MTKEKKQNNMEPKDEFRNIGKKLPYQEPVGFFDQISEKTLRQAKIREQNHKKNRTLWRTVAVAASLSALALLSYFMFEPEAPVTNPIALQQKPVNQSLVIVPELIKKPKTTEAKKTLRKNAPEKLDVTGNADEKISDVMADLSDEELHQLAVMCEADPFITDSEH